MSRAEPLWRRARASLLVGCWMALALPNATQAQVQPRAPRFVYDVPDGRLKGGARYSIRLEEVERTADGLVLRVIQRSGPQHARRVVSFRGICAYMATHDKKLAEVKLEGRERNLIHVHFPQKLSQAELDDESRHFFTDTLCSKLDAGPP
jgi:hypothetical protein